MKNSENLRTIVKIRKLYRRACELFVLFAGKPICHQTTENNTVEVNTKHPKPIQKYMNVLSWGVDWWNSASQWASVVLVAFTFAAGLVALVSGRVINQRQADRIAKLEGETATANRLASEANERAAKLNDQAKQSELKLERLRRRSLPRMEAFDFFAFKETLRKHPPARAMVITRTSDPESIEFAEQLKFALWSGRWTEVPPDLSFSCRAFTGGIILGANIREEPGKTSTPVGIIGTALEAAGIDAGGSSVQNNIPSDLVIIEVFPK